MSIITRIILILVAALCFYYVVNRYKASNFKISHTLFWIGLAFFLFITSLFPDYLNYVAHLVGMKSGATLIFLFLIFILLYKLFFLSLAFEDMHKKISELVIKLAEKELEEKKPAEKELEGKENGNQK